MDIQKWLDNTQHQSSDSDVNLQGREHRQDHVVAQHRSRKAHQAQINVQSGDGSPQVPRPAKRQRHRRERSLSQSGSSRASSTTGPTDDGSSAAHPSSSEKYERRKRHKTREDRYDPHAGPRKKRSKPKDKKRQKDESKHHRTERSKRVVKPGQYLLKNFSAPNMGGHRLTLHSPTRQGVLRHGRASSPQRRRGLPDLTFSEMRFLSRPVEPTDGPLEHKAKRRKQNSANEQEEISAFFTGNPAPLRARDNKMRAAEGRSHGKRTESQSHVLGDHEVSKSHGSLPDDSRSHATHNLLGREVSTRSRQSALTWPPSECAQVPALARLRPASTVAAGDLARHSTRQDIGPKEIVAPHLLQDKQDLTLHIGDRPEKTSQPVPVFEETRTERKITSAIQKSAGDTVSATRPAQDETMPTAVGSPDAHIAPTTKASSSPFAKLLRACGQVVDQRAGNGKVAGVVDEEPHLDKRSANVTGHPHRDSTSQQIEMRDKPIYADMLGHLERSHGVGACDRNDMPIEHEYHNGMTSIYVRDAMSVHQPSGTSTGFRTWRPELLRETIPDFQFSNPRHSQHMSRGAAASRGGHHPATGSSHDLSETFGSDCVHYVSNDYLQFGDEGINYDIHHGTRYPDYHDYQVDAGFLDCQDTSASTGVYYYDEGRMLSSNKIDDDQRLCEVAAYEYDGGPQDGVEASVAPERFVNMLRADEGQDIVPRGFWRPNVLY